MSITAETAKVHAKDPAVLCCRAEAGIIIEPVLGAKLTKTSDSLSPLTVDNVDGIKEVCKVL